MSHYPLEQIRRDYAALQELCYLNTGTVGVMSESVLARHVQRISEYERFGHYVEQGARDDYERSRNALAGLINASNDEITLNRNASDGINFVLASLNLPDGANLLTTDQEHPAVLLPMSLAVRKSGGAIEMLEITEDDDAFLTGLQDALSQKDIYLAIISHVSCETGKRLPINEVCKICRENGVLSLVDGAQSVGQFNVDVGEIGCDFMTGNGHKWICGPKGTGFLYIKQGLIESLTPPYVGDGAIDPRFDRAKFAKDAIVNDWTFRSDAQRFEFGTRNWHLYGGVADSIMQLEDIGWTAMHQHVAKLSTELKRELAERPNVTVQTPESWEDSCGIVTFSADGWDGVELSTRLWNDFGIVQRRVQEPGGVRISVAHYTERNDIDTFLTALDKLLA